jgi:predicted CXXCH cytochrome family protein
MECHDDIEEDLSAAVSRHQPVAAGECTGCHNPHKAALDTLLLAESPDLCLGCHDALRERLAIERTHSPVGRDCLRCHQPHLSSETRLLNQPLHVLCADCHEEDEGKFSEAHLGIAAAAMNCTKCHAPHASKDPMFFKAKMHSPFVKRNCEECHVAGEE